MSKYAETLGPLKTGLNKANNEKRDINNYLAEKDQSEREHTAAERAVVATERKLASAAKKKAAVKKKTTTKGFSNSHPVDSGYRPNTAQTG